MDLNTIVISTFWITVIYDVILRGISLNNLMPNTLFVTSLKRYYEELPLLTVAITAGVIGAMTQVFICLVLTMMGVFTSSSPLQEPRTPNGSMGVKEFVLIAVVTFVISAIMGFVLKGSGLFPKLKETYYKELGWVRGMLTDGISGLIVNGTLIGFIVLTSQASLI